MKKIYVDVDDTLILWGIHLTVNLPLVQKLHEGILQNEYDVTVWSGTGTNWAKKWSENLFPDYNLPFGSKEDLYRKVHKDTFAIDDRKQKERNYLKRFKQVFLPEEFIKSPLI